MNKKKHIVVTGIAISALILIIALVGSTAHSAKYQDTAAVMLTLGDEYLGAGDFAGALAAYDKLLELEPANRQALVGAAQAYIGSEQPHFAIELLGKALTYYPDSAELAAMLNELVPPQPSPEEQLADDISAVLGYIAASQTPPGHAVTEDFLRFHNAENPQFAALLKDSLTAEPYDDAVFYKLFGSTLTVLNEIYTQSGESEIISAAKTQTPPVLTFTGDLNLADSWRNMQLLYRLGGLLPECIEQPLLDKLRAADILLVNNEFCFSNRGEPMPGKLYTFRAKTENVAYLHEMGADIVSLANNHVFDFGAEAFYDTLDTLNDAGIRYVGAGADLEEAMAPRYYIINGIKIAYVSASRAEKYIMTPQAASDSPGILRTYDSALFLEKVRTARANADIVIAYVHWGTEFSYILEAEQTALAQELIEEGVDVIIGAHPHNLQGIEYFNGKPVVYSLGNFWFNTFTDHTALLEITIAAPDDIRLKIVPCMQREGKTTLLTESAAARELFDFLISISPAEIAIDDSGVLSSTKETT